MWWGGGGERDEGVGVRMRLGYGTGKWGPEVEEGVNDIVGLSDGGLGKVRGSELVV